MDRAKVLWASHFSGAGGSTLGAVAAGLTPVLAIDWDAEISALYKANINRGKHICSDVRLMTTNQWKDLKLPLAYQRKQQGQILVTQTSPPCKDFSGINATRKGTDNTLLFTLPFYNIYQPEIVILENVVEFQMSNTYQIFRQYLEFMNGYKGQEFILDSADFGVPQHRKRLFYIAYKNECTVPDLIKINKPWVGLWETIKPFWDGMDKVNPTDRERKILNITEVTRLEHCMIQRCGYSGKTCGFREGYKPSYTLKAEVADDGKGGTRHKFLDVWEESTRTLKTLNIPALAAIQTFPTGYKWGDDFKVNVRAIGNAVAPKQMQLIIEEMLKCN